MTLLFYFIYNTVLHSTNIWMSFQTKLKVIMKEQWMRMTDKKKIHKHKVQQPEIAF